MFAAGERLATAIWQRATAFAQALQHMAITDRSMVQWAAIASSRDWVLAQQAIAHHAAPE